MSNQSKKILTGTVVFILVFLVIWRCVYKINMSNAPKPQKQTEESTEAQKTFPYQVTKDTKTYTHRLQSEQLKQEGTLNYVSTEIDGKEVGVEVQVDFISVSRELPEGYQFSEGYQFLFKEENMDADGTFLKDFYYLNVHIKLVNQSDTPRLLTPRSLSFLFIDEDMDAWDIGIGSYDYSKALLTADAFDYVETDDSQLLATSMDTRMANKGEGCEYNAYYVIADQMYEDNQLYFAHTFGVKADEMFKNPNQIYIKCDMKK